jgi:hypothetical protein
VRRTRDELEGGTASHSPITSVGAISKQPGSSRLIISVGEARRLLGKDAKSLTDDQVEEQILLLSSLAENFLQDNSSKV